MRVDNHIFLALPRELISNANVVHQENAIFKRVPFIKKLALLTLILIFGTVSMTTGEVSTRVCLSGGETPIALVDPNVPYVYQDIMVGTRLTIIVSSDIAEIWSGSLVIEEEYWDYGVLSAREPNLGGDWSGSHLPAAGNNAIVCDWEEGYNDGFDLYTRSTGIEVGDWFIIDYTATSVGTCKVGFYNLSVDWFEPIYYLTFSHVQTRDFNDDSIVNFVDFATLASYWQLDNCTDMDTYAGTDLDNNGSVDIDDLIMFCDYWLEKTR